MNYKFKISNPSFSITNDSVYCILNIEDIPGGLLSLLGFLGHKWEFQKKWRYLNKKLKELTTKSYIGTARKKPGTLIILK